MDGTESGISGNEIQGNVRGGERPPEPPFAFGLQAMREEDAAYSSIYRDETVGTFAAPTPIDPSEGARVRHDIKAETEKLREQFLAEVQAQARAQNVGGAQRSETDAFRQRIAERRKQYQTAADQLSAPVAANEAAEIRIHAPQPAASQQSSLREGFTSPGRVLKQQEALLTENNFAPTRVLQAEHSRQFKEGFRRWFEKERDAEERRERVATDSNDPLRTNNFPTSDGKPSTADQPAAPPDSIGNQLTNPHETDRLNKPRITFQQIDSVDRDFTRYPEPNDYRISLSRRFNNVKRVKLIASEIPNTDQIIRDDPREALVTRNRLILRCGQVLNEANKHFYWIDESDGTQPGNYDCIVYDACITPGNYVAQACECNERTLASEIETQVSGINRFIDGRAHEFVVTIDEQTNKVSVLSIQSNELGLNPIDTVAGTNVITVTQLQHSFQEGDFVTISGATSTGGISANTLNATHQIISVPTADTYTIRVNTIASQTVGGGGSNVLAGQNRPFMLLASNTDTPFGSVLGFPQQDSAEQIATNIEFIDCEAPDLSVDPNTPTECGTINARICATNHCLTVGDEILILDTDTIPNINGLQTVTNVISDDKFEIGKKVKVVNNQTVTTQTILGSIKRSLDTEVSKINQLTVAQQGFICTECPHNMSTIVEDNTVWLGNLTGGLTEKLEDLNGIHTVSSVLADDKFTITDGIIFSGTEVGNAFVVKTSSSALVPITEIIPANNGRFCPPFISDPCCAAELSRIFTGSNVPEHVLFRNTLTEPDINGVVYLDVDTVGLCDEFGVSARLDFPAQSFTVTRRGFLIGIYIRLGNGLQGSTARLTIYEGAGVMGTPVGISPVTPIDDPITRGVYFCINPTVLVDCPSGLEVLAGTVLTWSVTDVKDTPIYLTCGNGGNVYSGGQAYDPTGTPIPDFDYEFCTFMSPGVQEVDFYSQTTGCFDLKTRECNNIETFPGLCEVFGQIANQEFIRSTTCTLRCIQDAITESKGEWTTDAPHNLIQNDRFYVRLKQSATLPNTTTSPFIEPNVLGIQTARTIFGSTTLDTTTCITSSSYASSTIASNLCIVKTNDVTPTVIENIYPATVGYLSTDRSDCNENNSNCKLCPDDCIMVRNSELKVGSSPFNPQMTEDLSASAFPSSRLNGCYKIDQIFSDVSRNHADIFDTEIRTLLGNPYLFDTSTNQIIDLPLICDRTFEINREDFPPLDPALICEPALFSPITDQGLAQFRVFEPNHMRWIGHTVRFTKLDKVHAQPGQMILFPPFMLPAALFNTAWVFPEDETFNVDKTIIEIIDADHYIVSTTFVRTFGVTDDSSDRADSFWPQVYVESVSPRNVIVPHELIVVPGGSRDLNTKKTTSIGEFAKLEKSNNFINGLNGTFNAAKVEFIPEESIVIGNGTIFDLKISDAIPLGGRNFAPCFATDTMGTPRTVARATLLGSNFTLSSSSGLTVYTLANATAGTNIGLRAGDPLSVAEVIDDIVAAVNTHGLFIAEALSANLCTIRFTSNVRGVGVAGATVGTMITPFPMATLSTVNPGVNDAVVTSTVSNGLQVRTKTPHGLSEGCLVVILLGYRNTSDFFPLSDGIFPLLDNCEYAEFPDTEDTYPVNAYLSTHPLASLTSSGGLLDTITSLLHQQVATVVPTSSTEFTLFGLEIVSGASDSLNIFDSPQIAASGDIYYHKICQDFTPFKKFFCNSYCGMIEVTKHNLEDDGVGDFTSIYIGQTNTTPDINGCIETKCLIEDYFLRYESEFTTMDLTAIRSWGAYWHPVDPLRGTPPGELITLPYTVRGGIMESNAALNVMRNELIRDLPDDFVLSYTINPWVEGMVYGYCASAYFNWQEDTQFSRFTGSGYFLVWISTGQGSFLPVLPNFHLHLVRADRTVIGMSSTYDILASVIPTGSEPELFNRHFRIEVQGSRIRVYVALEPNTPAFPVPDYSNVTGDIPIIDVEDNTYRNGLFGFAVDDGSATWQYVKVASLGLNDNVTVIDENFLGWVGNTAPFVVTGNVDLNPQQDIVIDSAGIVTGNTGQTNGFAGEFIIPADEIKIELNVTNLTKENNGLIFAENEFQGGECLYFLNDTNINEGTSQALAESIRVVDTENLTSQSFQLTVPITNFGGLLGKNIPEIGSDIFLYADPSLNPQIFIVPDSVYQINVIVAGGGGGNGSFPTGTGGSGGLVQGTLEVTPGEVYYIYVGGGGDTPSGVALGIPLPGVFSNGEAGANGGGLGAHLCGGGGGASDIRLGGTSLLDRIIVAGGGGGAGFISGGVGAMADGGDGGGATGGNGGQVPGGTGGTQVSGGTGGSGAGSTAPGDDGTLARGGDGGTPLGAPTYCDGMNSCGGGGGGGGYYGGGGGASSTFSFPWQGDIKGGGGGGSSLVPAGLITVPGGGAPATTDGFVIISIPSQQCLNTPGIYDLPIPPGVIAIEFEVAGAGGGPGAAQGGSGGLVGGVLQVSTLDTIQLVVGGAGGNPSAGFPNGGTGGPSSAAHSFGGGGGGASAVYFNGTDLDDRVLVGGGGGGASGSLPGSEPQNGGGGGGLVGENGTVSAGVTVATGGTQTSTGTNAFGPSAEGNPFEDQGGSPISMFGFDRGQGAGGGGWFGGGASSQPGGLGSGAGGSGRVNPTLVISGQLIDTFNQTGNGSPSATDGYICYRFIRTADVTLPVGHFIQLPSCDDNFNTIERIERKTNGVFTSSINTGFIPVLGNACELMTSNVGDCIFFTDGVYGDGDVSKLQDVLGNARPFPTPAPVFSLTQFDTDIVITPEDLEGGGGFPLGGNKVDPVLTNDIRFPGINGLGWIYATDCKINPITDIQRDSNGTFAPVKQGLTVGQSIFIDSQHPTIPDLNGVFTVSYIDVGNGSFPAFFELGNVQMIDIDGPVEDGNIFYFCSPPMVGNIDPCLPINEITANTCPTVIRVTNHGFTVGTTVNLYIIDSQTSPSINSVEGNTVVRDIINDVQVLDEDTLQLPLTDTLGNLLCDLEILNQTNLLVTPRGRFSKEFLSTNCGRWGSSLCWR